MRQVGTLSNENQARRLVNYLTSQGIDSKCEISFEPRNGHMSYQIWIQDEDKIDQAETLFKEFEQNPGDAKFDAPEPQAPPTPIEDVVEKPPHKFKTHLTYFIILVCALIYYISAMQRSENRQQILTPIQTDLMFDIPPLGEKAPYWQGVYGYVVAKFKGENPKDVEGPLFVKIREGEVYRLFTPCLLHFDLLHILFNMLWLWYLGRPIEERIGPFRMLLFTIVAGVLTNLFQYLMSGPLFIGYSGIVTALAGFIWMREKIAPWEGYPLSRGTLLFLLFFIIAIFGLQVVTFFIQVFTQYAFAPNIANTAHIGGALIGALLARLKFFAQRVKS